MPDSLESIGAGVIGDISEPKERGGFYGVYALGPMVGVEFAIPKSFEELS